MKGILVAVNFLTIVPAGSRIEANDEDYGRSMLYFPAVGALIGLSVWGASLFFHLIMAHVVATALALLLWVGISGALHLDGLADACDGFYGGKDRDGILRIMRDSSTGTMGAVAIAMSLMLKFSALVSVGPRVSGPWIIAACALSRWAMALSAAAAPYARESGVAKYFIDHVGRKELAISTVIAVGLSLLFFQAVGLLYAGLIVAETMALTRYFKKRIGGITGDTLGAINEIGELSMLILMAISLRPS